MMMRIKHPSIWSQPQGIWTLEIGFKFSFLPQKLWWNAPPNFYVKGKISNHDFQHMQALKLTPCRLFSSDPFDGESAPLYLF